MYIFVSKLLEFKHSIFVQFLSWKLSKVNNFIVFTRLKYAQKEFASYLMKKNTNP